MPRILPRYYERLPRFYDKDNSTFTIPDDLIIMDLGNLESFHKVNTRLYYFTRQIILRFRVGNNNHQLSLHHHNKVTFRYYYNKDSSEEVNKHNKSHQYTIEFPPKRKSKIYAMRITYKRYKHCIQDVSDLEHVFFNDEFGSDKYELAFKKKFML